MTDLEHLVSVARENISPIQWMLGGIVGFFISRWTLTKKERLDAEQKQFENGRDLMIAQNSRYQEFVAAMQKFVNKAGEPGVDEFVAIATTGDTYFHQLMINSNAVLAGKVSETLRNDTFVPRIEEAVRSNLPNYYSTLQSIAARKGFEYTGKLDRRKYEALYSVVEKYGSSSSFSYSADGNEIERAAADSIPNKVIRSFSREDR